jgi:hypothetical protein
LVIFGKIFFKGFNKNLFQITSLYGGPLEFLFVVESTKDPAYPAIHKLISDFQV